MVWAGGGPEEDEDYMRVQEEIDRDGGMRGWTV